MKQYFKKSITKRLVQGGVWAFSAKAGSGFLTIALTALVARMLSPKDVGLFFLSFSIIAMLSLFARFGFDQLGIKLIGKGLVENDFESVKLIALRIFKLVGSLTIIWSMIIILAFDYVSIRFFGEYSISGLYKMLFIAWLIVTTIQITFSEIFRSFQRIDYASLFSGGTAFGGFSAGLLTMVIILSLYFLKIKMSLELLLSVIIAATSIFLACETRLIIKLLQLKCKNSERRGTVCGTAYKELLGQGFYFFVINLSIFSLIHADIIILGFYRPVEEVAIYAATTRLVKLVTVSLIVIYETIAPMVVELNSKNNKEQLQRVLRVAATIAAIPTSLVLILFIFKSSEVLGYLYGEYYKEGVGIMIILSIGQLVNVWSGLSNYTLSITGYHKINMYIVSIVAVVAIICCLLFVREHGSYAIALIISIAWIIQNILAVIITRYLVGVWTTADIFFSYKELRSYLAKNK